jgi:hypothetical protein
MKCCNASRRRGGSLQKSIVATNIKRYGACYASMTVERKQMAAETCIERYGMPAPMQSPIILEKRVMTNIKRYGAPTPLQNSAIKEKFIKTNIERYGFPSPLLNSAIKEKSSATLLSNHGVLNPYNIPSVMTNANSSEACRKRAMTKAKLGNNGFRTGLYTSKKTGDTHPYESSWELMRMEFYDAADDVVSWERCKDEIEYVNHDGRLHRYNPDFMVRYADDNVVIEEVKGIIGHDVAAKFQAATVFYEAKGISYQMLSIRNNGWTKLAFGDIIEMKAFSWSGQGQGIVVDK